MCVSSTPPTNFIIYMSITSYGVSWWVSGKESTCQCKRHRFHPWIRKIPWKREWQPTPVFLPEKSHRQRTLTSYSPWGCKESDIATKQQQLPVINCELKNNNVQWCAPTLTAVPWKWKIQNNIKYLEYFLILIPSIFFSFDHNPKGEKKSFHIMTHIVIYYTHIYV